MFRNKTQNLIKKSKKNYIRNEISENQNSPQNLWKTLKNLGMPSKTRGGSANIGLRNDSDEILFDSSFVADKFNNFFCSIANKLVDKLPKREFNDSEILDFYKNVHEIKTYICISDISVGMDSALHIVLL